MGDILKLEGWTVNVGVISPVCTNYSPFGSISAISAMPVFSN